MMTRKNKGTLVVMVLGILGMVCFGTTHVLAATPQGVLKEAIHWSISADWLDPSTAHPSPLGWFILQFFHDALLKPMPEGFYTPCLAESYTVSPDSKVYEFKLRRGVKFHNGDPMTAEDVVFTYWRYKGREAKVIHDRTEKVEAVNPYLVRIQFKKPFPDFLDYFLQGATTIGWIVPKKYVEKVGDAAYKQNPVGAGPYKFAEFVPGVKIAGEAFEDYWRKVPNIKRMEFYDDPRPDDPGGHGEERRGRYRHPDNGCRLSGCKKGSEAQGSHPIKSCKILHLHGIPMGSQVALV